MDTESVIHSDGGFASVAFLRIKRAVLVDKSLVPLSLVTPSLLLAEYQRVQVACSEEFLKVDPSSTSLQDKDPLTKTASNMSDAGGLDEDSVLVTHTGSWVSIVNIQAPVGFQTMTVDQEVKECFLTLQSTYQKAK